MILEKPYHPMDLNTLNILNPFNSFIVKESQLKIFNYYLIYSTWPIENQSLKVIDGISGIDLLLQKVGTYLEHLELELGSSIERKKALYGIINNCNKIKFLCLSYTNWSDASQLIK